MDFQERLQSDKKTIEEHLNRLLPPKDQKNHKLIEAMEYSLQAGGKRLRPILFLETLRLFEEPFEEYLDLACALELIHTYSLIHDDLPAMDDDALRRGKPTNHIVFGEAAAILAGDGLLNYAYERMMGFLQRSFSLQNVSACAEIATAAGVFGMVGGQIVDIESEKKEVDIETMEYIHRHKTAALIEASMVSAAMVSGADERELSLIRNYAGNLGLLFQITDDLLDETGEEALLGKKVRKDDKIGKATYPKLFGIEKSRKTAERTAASCRELIRSLERETGFFEELAEYILNRKK